MCIVFYILPTNKIGLEKQTYLGRMGSTTYYMSRKTKDYYATATSSIELFSFPPRNDKTAESYDFTHQWMAKQIWGRMNSRIEEFE